MLDLEACDKAADLLAAARSALFITGAGISADSGLPTYRGIGGLYDIEDTEEGLPIEVALSGDMMRARPEVAWKHIGRIERACRGARPNAAHDALAKLERWLDHTCVLTQNVDGLHQRAGSRNVIAIHGDVHQLHCTRCSHQRQVADYRDLELPPRCTECGGWLRPRVVLFGEMLPEAAVEHLERELARGFDVVFSIGTTSSFAYISGPVVAAIRSGVPVVEINPAETAVSEVVTLRIRAGAAAALPPILIAYRERRP